jgi:bacillithiol biosynthesis deacetylase BshB1
MADRNNKTDFMAIGAHADDVELLAGGTVIKLASRGKKGVIVDMTDGAAGTRGTPEIRIKEARAAARVLGIEHRENLGFPDARLSNTWEAQRAVIAAIRKYRPHVLLTHHWKDEHPDHIVTAEIVKAARYKAGLANCDCPGRRFRPHWIFYFMGPEYFTPSFCVDISDFWEKKIKSILSYKSQFYGRDFSKYKGRTEIATPDFLDYLEVRARFFGWRIKRKYAEPFYCPELPEVDDLTELGGKRF